MAVTHVFSNAVPDATGTLTVWYGATTATVAATDIVRPSNWNEAHAQIVTLGGNTAGVSTVSGTNIVFGGSNNVTLSGIQGANAATINFSAAAGGGGGSVNLSAGTTSNNLTNFVFADSNGVSFGLNGSTITATVRTDYQSAGAYLTTARASNDAVGLNTAQNNVTWTVNSSGLSLDARGYAGTNTGATGASVTANSNGVSVSVTQSNQAVSANNGSFAFQTLSFSNANGISFGTSAGNAITASHNALTTARASNDGIGLNTAQTNVTWTVNSAGLSLNAAGYAGTGTTFNGANVSGSMTVNSNGVNLSLSAGAGGGGLTQGTFYAQSNTTQSSSGTIALSSLNFAGAGIASVGITNGSVLISVPSGGGAGDGGVSAGVSNLGNTAGSTGVQTAGNFVLVGSNGITLSQSTGAGNATVTIQGAPPVSFYENFLPNVALGSVGGIPSQSTSMVFPFVVPLDLSASFMRMPFTFITNSSSAATSINTTFSASRVTTYNFVVYSQGTGANSESLRYVTSTSAGATQQWSLGANSTGSQYTVTLALTYPVGSGTNTYSTSYATSQTRFDFSSNSLTLFTGRRPIDFPFAMSLSRGNYWMAYGASSTNGTQAVAGFSNLLVQMHIPLGITGDATSYSVFGATNSQWPRPWHGQFSAAGGGTTSSIASSVITTNTSQALPHFQFHRFA